MQDTAGKDKMEQTWNLPSHYLRFGVGEGKSTQIIYEKADCVKCCLEEQIGSTGALRKENKFQLRLPVKGGI